MINKSISKKSEPKVVEIKEITNWNEYLDQKEERTGEKCILKTRSVDIFYKTKKEPFHAVKDVSINLYKGEVLGLVGESGSGKSTFGKALTKQVDHKGHIQVKDIVLPEKLSRLTPDVRDSLVKNIQMIFQDPTDSLNPYRSIRKNVLEGMNNVARAEKFALKKSKEYNKEVQAIKKQERKEFLNDTLNSVGFDGSILGMYPLELSGGQQQRVSIARALLIEPEIIVADEPISALDVSIQAQVINIMNELKQERNLSILFIAHDLRMVEYISTRIAIMNKGRIVEILPSRKIDEQAIHPYTLTLLSAVPSINEFNINLLKRSHDQDEYEIFEGSRWWEIEKDHYVFGLEEQIRRWKREAKEG